MQRIITLYFLTLVLSTNLIGQYSDNCDPNNGSGNTWTIACGDSDSWNNSQNNDFTSSPNESQSYLSCLPGSTAWFGPEYKYIFTAPYNGSFTFNLTIDQNTDLDMILLNSCNASTCFNSDGATSSTSFETTTVNLTSGQEIIIVIDGWNGAVSDYTLSASCSESSACENGTIDCAETKIFSTLNSGNDINWQNNSCVNSQYDGNDLLITFERSSSYVTNWITMWNRSLENIDLFIFAECPLNSGEISPTCIGSSTNLPKNCGPLNFESLSLNGYPAGTYYILIDGKTSNDADNQIYLSVSCEGLDCDDNTPIFCDTPITTTNVGITNRTSNYYGCYDGAGCFNFEGSWTAGEKIFKFTAPEDGDYSFCMDPSGDIDLELFLFDFCCETQFDPGTGFEVTTDFACYNNCQRAQTSGSGQTEVINDFYMNKDQEIWIIVDGFLGDEGTFTMEVKCNNFDCNETYDLSCGLIFDDTTDPNSGTFGATQATDIFDSHNDCSNKDDGYVFEGFSNNTPFAEHEVVYFFDGAEANGKDVTFDVFPRVSNQDLDLFVYETCSNGSLNNCAHSSTYGTGLNDAIILNNVSPFKEYYVVVDGQSNNTAAVNSGRFGFSVTCGKLNDHTIKTLPCEDPIFGNTSFSTNRASYYCNCDNEDPNRSAGGNNGKEDVYELNITSTSTITLTLDQMGNQDLELYLLNELDSYACNKNSRNPAGQTEQITATLSPGKHYVVVEGYDGDEGSYRLFATGCADECPNSQNQFCYDFQNYLKGIGISGQAPNWTPNFFNLGEGDCKIQAEAVGSSNNVLQVQNENNLECASGLTFNDVAASDIVELSFRIKMPYYNFGTFPLQADGAEISIYEDNPNSQDNIYIAFRPHSNNSTDDRRICVNINNVYISDGCLNGDGELFAYDRNDWNDVKIRLKKSTQTVSVLINEQLVGSASNTGMDRMRFIGFRSVFNPNGPFLIDDLCFNSCSDCNDDQWFIVDEEGNPPCSGINVQTLSQSNDSNVSVTFTPDVVSSDFEKWEIRDADTEQVIQTNTSNASSFNYCCFNPGRKYYICYWYRDALGCLEFCCIKFEIPTSCNFFTPNYDGDENNISYNLNADGLTGSQTVSNWFDGVSANSIGSTSNITYVPNGTGIRYICCLIFDPSTRCYILCCRKICVDNPYSCNSFTSTYNAVNDEYTFTAAAGAQDITWYLDSPISAIIGSNNPQKFKPASFNIPTGNPFQVSYRYRDSNNCIRFCCKSFNPVPPPDALTLELGKVCGSIGSTVRIPITVKNFDNLSTGSFTVRLDNNFAKIRNIELVSLPPNPSSNLIDDRTLIFNWLEANSTGITLPDGATIANVVVEILGNGFQNSTISISSNPAPIEFTTANLQSVPIETIAGEVCLSSKLTLAGTVAKSTSSPVADVAIQLTGGQNQQTTTNISGQYSFEVDAGFNYSITPKKDVNDRNGISGVDLLILQRHLLFIQRLEDPYLLIAADLNNDKTISGTDLLLLQRMIIFLTPEFQFVDSWRFVDKDYIFPTLNTLSNPFPESINYAPLIANDNNADFVAVKMGDLDNSAMLQNKNEDIHKKMCAQLSVQDQELSTGQNITINIMANDFNQVAVLTAELKFDNSVLKFKGFKDSHLPGFQSANISTALEANGYLIANWISGTGLGENLDNGSTVFSLEFEVLNFSKLSDAFTISNDNLNSEIVDEDLNTNCIEMIYDMISASDDILQSNYSIEGPFPNPSSDMTTVILNANENTQLQFGLYDQNGNLINSKNISITEGRNLIEINLENHSLPQGVYYFQLRNNQQIHSGKIVYLK